MKKLKIIRKGTNNQENVADYILNSLTPEEKRKILGGAACRQTTGPSTGDCSILCNTVACPQYYITVCSALFRCNPYNYPSFPCEGIFTSAPQECEGFKPGCVGVYVYPG